MKAKKKWAACRLGSHLTDAVRGMRVSPPGNVRDEFGEKGWETVRTRDGDQFWRAPLRHLVRFATCKDSSFNGDMRRQCTLAVYAGSLPRPT
jgi:hypothetical protein